jgi:hypothetical protein
MDPENLLDFSFKLLLLFAFPPFQFCDEFSTVCSLKRIQSTAYPQVSD